ncbi:ParB N-terminal domain-containing protein [Streptomyces sp. AD2-2]|nr:ParB N-terminal domain-containing protein [Streptomyces sp. AD2-2]
MEDTTRLAPPQLVQGDPRTLTLLDINARFLPHEQFRQLVENIERDGCLTSTPLVWNDAESGRLVVLSGNHRTLAAIEAGLSSIWWMQIDEPLPRQRQIALQLSHNAIAGQDDPAILKELYDELESVEWRQYTGLDDKTLDLLEKVDVSSSVRRTSTSRACSSCSCPPNWSGRRPRSTQPVRRRRRTSGGWLGWSSTSRCLTHWRPPGPRTRSATVLRRSV